MRPTAQDHSLELVDFFGGHASASPQVMSILAVVLFYIFSFSSLLRTFNYYSQRHCPWTQGFDLGLVFVATSAVEFSEGEALALVNEQAQDGYGMVGVLELIRSQILISICDLGFSEELLPGLFDVGLGLQNGLLLTDFAHCLLPGLFDFGLGFQNGLLLTDFAHRQLDLVQCFRN